MGWLIEFRCDRTRTCDSKRSGRPHEVATPETTDKIHGMLFVDWQLKVRETKEVMDIPHGSVVLILNYLLGKRKLFARWVRRLLTVGHKSCRVTTSKEYLAMFNRNRSLRRIMTVDERYRFATR